MSTIYKRRFCIFLGLDHERLTYTYQGRQFRLTDVHGHLVTKLLS